MFTQQKYVLCFAIFLATAAAQQYHYFVTTSNSSDATAFNNSHKVVTHYGEGPNDTIHVVYHSSDSIYYTCTTDGGPSWQTPLALHPGTNPAFDRDRYGFRHIAWQYFDIADSNFEIYYDCLDDWSPPINVSESSGNSIFPDLVVDSNFVVHITWTEQIDDYSHIYYRSCELGVLTDTVRISEYGSAQAAHSHSSISIFQPNYRIYVLWCCVDTSTYTPYHIVYRYKEGTTWFSTIPLAADWQTLRHPSLDFSHGEEPLSACWEDSTSGNLEATFYGGNGGGYATQGRSLFPVISTVGTTWSYLFWQEDSAGCEDIYYHLYYEFAGGWYASGSLRELFTIQEPVKYPNCCGAYLVWTQGENPPYSIYFADFGYPIGIQESETNHQSISLTITPNPFIEETEIKYGKEHRAKDIVLEIYDISGRLLRQYDYTTIRLSNKITWHGDDNFNKKLPAGTYFCVLKTGSDIFVKKIVRVE